jgi:hypothetical protein
MEAEERGRKTDVFLAIVVWGAIWGIFEATVGYVLHLLPVSLSSFVLYPAACFFMANVYRNTKRTSSVIFAGLLCAAVKMLNLLLPGRIDRVVNPAVSIVFEALAMAAAVALIRYVWGEKQKGPTGKAFIPLGANTGWRVLFVLYLLFLVPEWMREISVISAMEKFVPFFVTQNAVTSALLWSGYQCKPFLFKPVEKMEQKVRAFFTCLPANAAPYVKTAVVFALVCANVALELLL